MLNELYDFMGNLELSIGEGVKVRVERMDPNVGLRFIFVWLSPAPQGMKYVIEKSKLKYIVDDELLYKELVFEAKRHRSMHQW